MEFKGNLNHYNGADGGEGEGGRETLREWGNASCEALYAFLDMLGEEA